MFTIPGSPSRNSLRWSRRAIAVILVIATFTTVTWAGASPAEMDPPPSTMPPTQPTQVTTTPLASMPTSVETQTPNLPAPSTPTSTPTFTASPMLSPLNALQLNEPGDPVIGAAGDIACDPASSSFNGGNGTSTSCRQKAVSDVMLNSNLTDVLVLGDLQYPDGTLSRFQQSYDLSWGRLKSITHPAVGNHEYQTAGASGYFSYFGASAGDPAKGYYSYDLGAWHIIVLNSNCTEVGGCEAGSPQEQWLKADLAAHPNVCTLAYFHHPRFSSGKHGNDIAFDAFWNALYAAGVEVVLNGHDHIYERFAPQNPRGGADPNGIQQFIVGTGGKELTSIASVQPNSAVRNTNTFGFLKMALHPSSYDWQFVPEPGKTFTDSGSRNCVGSSSSPPTATPTQTQTPNIPPTATSINTNTPTATTTQSVPSSGSLTFTPVADAYVTSAIPNTNYGTSKRIRVDASPAVTGYLTFNIQGVNAPIASVKLRLYANTSSSQGFNVFGVPNTSWEEKSITFNNAPPPGSQIASSGALQSDAWKKVDVTGYVTGNGMFSIALTGVSNTAVVLASRETGAKAPQLIITTR